MIINAVVRCEHGYARSYDVTTARYAEPLPEIEYCPTCDADTVPLESGNT